VARIGTDLCDALGHAHGRGVVHRDVKPQNAIVRPFDSGGRRAKLMDFGIAAVAGAPTLTVTGEVVGTLAYMSPEQAEGSCAGPAADVYSLALTLYECWSGENPNRRATPAATARAIGTRPRSLRRLRPDLPRELCDTVDACLQRRSGRRPALEELGTAIEDSLDRLADQPARAAPALGLRLGVAAAAAALGAWLAVGHGAFLP
jgi:serine/threonine-protein kinase